MLWPLAFLGGNTHQRTDSIKLALDLVTHTAQLASNPSDIDLILDEFRKVTVHLNPGQTMSTEDEQVILKVYLQLEEYLTTKEPLRAFTKDELRSRCDDELRAKLTSAEKSYPIGHPLITPNRVTQA